MNETDDVTEPTASTATAPSGPAPESLPQIPRRRLWWVMAAAVVAAILILWLLPPIMASFTTTGGADRAQRYADTASLRTALLALGAATLAAVGAHLTHQTVRLNRVVHEANVARAREAHQLNQRAQFSDRYVQSLDLLSKDDPALRLGGVYAIESVARESGPDQPAAMSVLGALIRQHAKQPPDYDVIKARGGLVPRSAGASAEIHAALNAIVQRRLSDDPTGWTVDLAGTDLSWVRISAGSFARIGANNADMRHAEMISTSLAGIFAPGLNISNARLVDVAFGTARLDDLIGEHAHLAACNLNHFLATNVDLINSTLTECSAEEAGLMGARLEASEIRGGNFCGANLARARFGNASLANVDFNGAILMSSEWQNASISGTSFDGSTLQRARFNHAALTDVSFRGADLRGADFGGCAFHGVDVTDAKLGTNQYAFKGRDGITGV